MFVKDFSKEIDAAMERNDGEAVNMLIAEGIKHYSSRLNDAVTRIPKGDIPLIVTALESFKTAILGILDEDEKEMVEDLVDDLLDLCKINVHKILTKGPITEEAAKELYKASKERVEQCRSH